jgi:hypothetical protein
MITIELFGVPRLHAGTREVQLDADSHGALDGVRVGWSSTVSVRISIATER